MEGGIIDTLLLTIHHLVDARLVDASTRMESSDIWHITADRNGIAFGGYCSNYVLFICALLGGYCSRRTLFICVLLVIIVRGAFVDLDLHL